MFMIFSFAVIANAYESAEVTLSLDKATLVAGSLPETIEMTVKTTKSVNLTSFWGTVSAPSNSNITIKEMSGENLTTKKFAWMSPTAAEVETWSKVVFNIPADLAIGEYTLGVEGLDCKNASNKSVISNTTATVKFTVVAKEMTGIEIATAPAKTTYIEGQNFDKTGMVVNAVYNDDSRTPVTAYTITDGNALTAGKTSVTVSYTEGGKTKTAAQNITVESKKLVDIDIKAGPAKKSYVAGQNFDKAGMSVEAIYNDGSAKPITTFTVTDGNALTIGKKSVTISYTEGGITKTATQSITVSAKALTGKVEIEGTAKVGEKVTAKVTDSNNSGTLSYQWLRDGQSIAGATGAEYELTAEDVGKTISVAVSSNKEGGNITGTMTDPVAKADGAEAPADIKAEGCTTADNNDGKITGVDETMEYQKDGDAEWTPVTGNEIANLAAGKYNVRYKETAGKNASAVAAVEVPSFVEAKITAIALAKKELDLNAGEMALLDATVTPADADEKIVYESSDASVVSVDENGIAKALKAGTATITAKTADGTVKDTCTITVTEHVCGINIPWWIWVIIAALAVAVIVLVVLLISKKKKNK